jgi:serine/threonine-protein kinase HipA
MNCLRCGKPLRMEDEQTGWHKRCIMRFFGTPVIPKVEMDEKTLELLAVESANKGYTVPGVQKKLSLHIISIGKKPRLTLLNYPTGYILKPQVKDFRSLPEAEQLVMCMADAAGISTVPHALILENGSFAYISKRVDRIFEKDQVRMLAMEDFCQLDLRLTQDKYKGSYERCGKIILKFSSRAKLDMTELYMRLVFSYLIGNSDMHLKNLSLIETAEGSGQYVLSLAYDLLPVNVIMPEDKEQFALTMNGKKMNIHKKDFLMLADKCDISRSSAEKMIRKVVSMKPTFITMCNESLLPEDLKERFALLIEERSKIMGV